MDFYLLITILICSYIGYKTGITYFLISHYKYLILYTEKEFILDRTNKPETSLRGLDRLKYDFTFIGRFYTGRYEHGLGFFYFVCCLMPSFYFIIGIIIEDIALGVVGGVYWITRVYYYNRLFRFTDWYYTKRR